MAKKENIPLELELYAVRNSDGQWFRAKGRDGYGETWVDDIKKARIYGKIGPARATITFFANHYPRYPAPALVRLVVKHGEIVDETERVNKAVQQKKKKEAAYEKQRREWKLEQARRDFEEAQARLRELE